MNATFLVVSLIYAFGLTLFLNGFLLTRRVLLQNSTGTFPPSTSVDFDRVILLVIDALRFDFIQPTTTTNSTYLNQMPFVRELLEKQSKQAVLLQLLADPPTTTLQRLKALTTGTLPTFIDMSYNFVGYEIEEDNIFNQIDSSHGRSISLLGDDTWLALYPNVPFKHLHVYPSFDVHDLDTVDNGILEHLWNVIDETSSQLSSFIIAHFLGVDHCGHRYGPTHVEMKRKLNQMDDVIRNITLSFHRHNSSSLLMVIGDHGMTQQGDHGGDDFNEIQTAMFLYTNKADYFVSSTLPAVSQIDVVPTLAWFLHILVPFSSLGMMIIDVIPIEQRHAAMKLNFEQMEIYLQQMLLTLPLSDELHQLRANLRSALTTFEREKNLTIVENTFNKFKWELQAHFRRQWSTFNISRIVTGLILMFFACAVLLFLYLKFLHYRELFFNLGLSIIYFAISFSNSFIINEAACLSFLIQTILLTKRIDFSRTILISCLLFITRTFLICREEQLPHCVDPLWLISKSSDTPFYLLLFFATIGWIFLFVSKNNNSYVLPYLSLVTIVAYWFNLPYTLSLFYLTIFVQIGFVIRNRFHFDSLLYSLLIFVTGYRFAFSIQIQYFIYYLLIKHQQSSPLLLSILADYFFYATAHQPVLSQIRWTAAFPSVTSQTSGYISFITNSLVVRGTLVLVETFSSQILSVLFIRQIAGDKQKQLIKHVLTIDCCKLCMTSLSVFILRRHLMLWKIFCPRFLFQLVAFAIKWIFVILTMKTRK